MFESIPLPNDPASSLLFAPQFLSADEAETLFQKLLNETPWQQQRIRVYGKEYPEPRLTAWYGDAGARYEYSGLVHEPLAWTPVLSELRARIVAASGERFNSVLLNHYRDGRDSVGWHSDDEPELGRRPCVASLSLGVTRRFLLRPRQKTGAASFGLDLPAGSLLVMQGAIQANWQHALPKTARVHEPRINLSFRQVA